MSTKSLYYSNLEFALSLRNIKKRGEFILEINQLYATSVRSMFPVVTEIVTSMLLAKP